MEQLVTVVIVEDQPVITEGVASWIRSDPGQRVLLDGASEQPISWAGAARRAGRICSAGSRPSRLGRRLGHCSRSDEQRLGRRPLG